MGKKVMETKKYRILEFLKKLPYEEYQIAKKKLPIALSISKRTFERWLYMTKDNTMQIPADKLAIISFYLRLDSMDVLINYKVPEFNTSKLKSLKNSNAHLIKTLNLTK